MHKVQITTKTSTAGLGTLLLRKVKRTPTATQDLGTFAKMHITADAPPMQRAPGGLFAPMFATTEAATIAKAALPVPATMPRQTATLPEPVPNALIAQRQNIAQRFGEPSALNAVLHRESAAAHASLMASIKACHANPSTGPVALR